MKYKKTKYDDRINLVRDDGMSETFFRGTDGYKEYESFVESGGVAEECVTENELRQSLIADLKQKRNLLIREADKWELPTVLQRFNITVEQVLQYKLDLIAMDTTHTTTEQLENPQWPVKLITQELL